MSITLIGCGCGALTEDARAVIDRAALLIGSKRMLEAYGGNRPQIEAVTADAITAAIEKGGSGEIAVLFSGDLGFCSGARLLLPGLADL